jgi:uncharacterized protein YjbI with pentapeptide repeats
MSNKEQVALLRKGVRPWNAWRSSYADVAIDLSGAALQGTDLSQVNLRGADLRDANLELCDFTGADVSDANLTAANLRGAELRWSNLSWSDLGRAKLKSAYLCYTVLCHAKLSGTDMRACQIMDANFCHADLRRARFDTASILGANFWSARLERSSFRNAELAGCIFAHTDLSSTRDLESCDYRFANSIDYETLKVSGALPVPFLRGCDLPDVFIDYLPSLRTRPIEFHSCFISYSHADKPFARRLHDQLQARGVRCWLDEHQMLPGDDLFEQIQQGIRLWDKVLLCCSKASLKSWWVDNEIETAFDKERRLMRQHGRKILSLIPLNLDGYLLDGRWRSGKREQILSRLAADFTGWESSNARFEAAFERVVRALRSDENARMLPPSSSVADTPIAYG